MNTVSAIIAPKHKLIVSISLGILFLSQFAFRLELKAQAKVMASTNSYYHGLLFSGEGMVIDSLQSEELMLEGVKEKILGNMALAADYFLQSINADPRNDGSLYELALIKINSKDYGKAREYITRALEVKPKEPFFLKALLDVQNGLNDRVGMEKTLNQLILGSPDKSEYTISLADLYLDQAKVEDAIQVYNRYENHSGDFNLAELQKEKIYLSHNQGEKALESMKVLLQKYPSNTRYYLLISEIYRSLGKNDKAWESLKAAQRISPEDGFLRLGIFEYFVSAGMTKQADSALERTFQSDEITLDQKVRILQDYYLKQNFGSLEMAKKLSHQLYQDFPENSMVAKVDKDINLKAVTESNPDRINLAQFLETKGGDYKTWNKLISMDYQARDMKAVADHAGKALELYPNQIILYWYQGNALKGLKNYPQAVQSIRNGLAMAQGEKEQEAVLLQELGEIYHASGNINASDSAFAASLKRSQNPTVLNNFSYYLALRNTKLNQADSMSALANTLEPGNANYEDTFAWILYKEKKYPKAKIWIEKAIADDKSSSPTFFDHYGDILFENHEVEKAIEAWNKALSLGSRNILLKEKINKKHP